MREHLKFKQLLNQFRSLKFEGQYMEDVLMHAHVDFDEACRQYMEENDIKNEDFAQEDEAAKEDAQEENEEIFEPTPEPDELRLFKKAHRKLVKILHPDRIRKNDSRKEEFTEDFKRMQEAIQNETWSDFFDLADKYHVRLDKVEEANRLLLLDISKISDKIDGKRKTFSWFLQQCNDDKDCRDNVVELFLRTKYGWVKPK